jgi:formate dehydrogenase
MVFLRSASRLARPASSLLSARAGPRLTSSLRQPNAFRTLTASASQQGKVLLVLYDVGQLLHPAHARPLTTSQGHEHAQQEPRLLGTTENELGIRKWIEDQGHTLVTTSDKEGKGSEFDKHLVDAEVIITTPYVCRHELPRNCRYSAPQPRGELR